MLPDLVKQLRLVIHGEFAFDDAANPAIIFKLDKDLSDKPVKASLPPFGVCL